jgi:hypothetical protein
MPAAVSRVSRIALITLAVLLFGVVSVFVGRLLGASTAARDDVTEVIKLQARGDAAGVARRIEGCRAEPACTARIAAQVRRLRARGRVRIVRIDDVAKLSLASRTDTARVVWKAGARLPTVQCVRVRRAGNPFRGYDIHVLSLGPPIGREASCPG